MARSRSAGWSRVTSRSPMRIRPAVTFSRPPMERRRVVFPHPDGPTRTMNSPSPIVRLTPSTAVTPPGNSFVTFSSVIRPTARNLTAEGRISPLECARAVGSDGARAQPALLKPAPQAAPRRGMQSLPHRGPSRIDSASVSRSVPSAANEVARGISCFRDTCNVYVLRSGRDAVLVDFGSGAVADHLPEIGVARVTDVLVTHHHRDQVQGLARAVAAGARIWVPPVEAELIADVDAHWQRRPLDVDYDLR